MDWLTLLAGAASALVTQGANEYRIRQERKKLEEKKAQEQWEMKELLADNTKHIANLNQAVVKAEKLAKVHIDNNEAFDKKATEAWGLYQESSIQAGNAQAMLLRELELAVSKLNQYRIKEKLKPVEVNPQLREMVSDFKGSHVR